MSRKLTVTFILASVVFLIGEGNAVDRSGYDELTRLVDSAVSLETSVFAPRTWEKAIQAFDKAKKIVEADGKQKDLDKEVARAREYASNALRACDVGKLSLQAYLEPRNKAAQAKAPLLVSELSEKAEAQFLKATARAESGDVRGALQEAEKAVPLFDEAELAAIRVEILSAADKLIEKAVQDDAEKFAPSTLDKARTARNRANEILTSDRYNRSESVEAASLAAYEARHASNIGLSVRSLNRNDQAWEKLMLGYEIQLARVGEVGGFIQLPFDNGPSAVADALIDNLRSLQDECAARKDSIEMTAGRLRETLGSLGLVSSEDDPVLLASDVQKRVKELLEERGSLTMDVAAGRQELMELEQKHEGTATELLLRKQREDKFKRAKQTLNPSEGEILFNSSNDIVLRLTGLSFDVNKSEIKEEHIALLQKVEQVIRMFPDSRLIVEGHTDASGVASANLALSEKRALSVMQYLRQSLLIPADRIQAVGFGSEKPIASNQSAEGRAKNRRIDILILQ